MDGTPPSAAAVKRGDFANVHAHGSLDAIRRGRHSVQVQGLEPDTAYRVFFVLENLAGADIFSAVSTMEVRTHPCAPAIDGIQIDASPGTHDQVSIALRLGNMPASALGHAESNRDASATLEHTLHYIVVGDRREVHEGPEIASSPQAVHIAARNGVTTTSTVTGLVADTTYLVYLTIEAGRQSGLFGRVRVVSVHTNTRAPTFTQLSLKPLRRNFSGLSLTYSLSTVVAHADTAPAVPVVHYALRAAGPDDHEHGLNWSGTRLAALPHSTAGDMRAGHHTCGAGSSSHSGSVLTFGGLLPATPYMLLVAVERRGVFGPLHRETATTHAAPPLLYNAAAAAVEGIEGAVNFSCRMSQLGIVHWHVQSAAGAVTGEHIKSSSVESGSLRLSDTATVLTVQHTIFGLAPGAQYALHLYGESRHGGALGAPQIVVVRTHERAPRIIAKVRATERTVDSLTITAQLSRPGVMHFAIMLAVKHDHNQHPDADPDQNSEAITVDGIRIKQASASQHLTQADMKSSLSKLPHGSAKRAFAAVAAETVQIQGWAETFAVTGLSAGTNYSVNIVAEAAGDTWLFGPVLQFNVSTYSKPPALLHYVASAIDGSTTAIMLTYELAGPGRLHYAVLRSVDSTFNDSATGTGHEMYKSNTGGTARWFGTGSNCVAEGVIHVREGEDQNQGESSTSTASGRPTTGSLHEVIGGLSADSTFLVYFMTESAHEFGGTHSEVFGTEVRTHAVAPAITSLVLESVNGSTTELHLRISLELRGFVHFLLARRLLHDQNFQQFRALAYPGAAAGMTTGTTARVPADDFPPKQENNFSWIINRGVLAVGEGTPSLATLATLPTPPCRGTPLPCDPSLDPFTLPCHGTPLRVIPPFPAPLCADKMTSFTFDNLSPSTSYIVACFSENDQKNGVFGQMMTQRATTHAEAPTLLFMLTTSTKHTPGAITLETQLSRPGIVHFVVIRCSQSSHCQGSSGLRQDKDRQIVDEVDGHDIISGHLDNIALKGSLDHSANLERLELKGLPAGSRFRVHIIVEALEGRCDLLKANLKVVISPAWMSSPDFHSS